MNRRNNTGSSTNKEITIYVVKEIKELLPYLFELLSNRGRNSVKAILTRGQVTINGHVQKRHNHILQPGDQVAIHWKVPAKEVRMSGVKIIHEDDDLIVVEKEAGLLSIATEKERHLTAYGELMEHVRRSNSKDRVFIVHRLDRDTSGVMMFAKSKEIQQTLQNSWLDLVLERTYIALVEGVVHKPGTVTSWLKESKSFKMHSSQRPNDGQKAVTHYKVIQSNQNLTLLQVNLETGRKNQIRVHMQDIGHPIVGDKKYGSRNRSIGRLGLHAQVIAFKHPKTGEHLRFEAKTPAVFMRSF